MNLTMIVTMLLAASFEVASVKPDKSETGVDRIKISKGSLIIENVSLKRCIGMAFGIEDGRNFLMSGPDWVDSERFDISAKFPPETPESELAPMLQNLLAERFHMAVHRETRQFSAYALVIGKGGSKLHRSETPQKGYRFRAQAGHATGSSISMPMFADRLSRPDFQLDRRVVDLTGLEGTYDIKLDWDDMSIFTAIQEQLGLRLEGRKIDLEVLVVDHVDRVPTAN